MTRSNRVWLLWDPAAPETASRILLYEGVGERGAVCDTRAPLKFYELGRSVFDEWASVSTYVDWMVNTDPRWDIRLLGDEEDPACPGS